MKTPVIKVHPQYPELDKIAHCAKIVRKGGLVIFPTETVYGIAADYNNPQAIERLRHIKHRDASKPFSVLISQKGLVSNYTSVIDPAVYKLVDEYWPGPLTVIVPTKDGHGSIGIRMPLNIVSLHLVQECQCTVAAPSANIAGRPPPVTCEDALRDLDGQVDVAIDGGPAKIGSSSSVVDLTGDKPKLLREGVITQKDVDEVVRKKHILFICTGNSCRSVMAEYLLKCLLKGRNDVAVVSAGTGVFLRSSASSETLAVLKRRDIDASDHQSQPLNTILLKKSDLILVMTKMHRQQVLERVPDVEKRVYLLREFSDDPVSNTDTNMDIPDPIGKTPQAYEDCMVTIQEAVHKLVKLL